MKASTAPSHSEIAMSSPIGLVAGNGQFPLEFAANARERGLEVVTVALKGEADPRIQEVSKSTTWVSVGQLGKLIRSLRRAGCRQVAFAGGVTRINFVAGFRIDWVGLRMLAKLRSFNDDSIIRGVIGTVEAGGLEVIAASALLEQSVPKVGVLTQRGLNSEEVENAQIGWEAARTTGALDIGQAIVVRNKTVIAVEAVEGTDKTLIRAGDVRGERGVLVKLAKPHQELRIDLPAIGVQTIELMHKSRVTALVIEAGKALMLDPQAIIECANRLKVAIVAAESKEQLRVDC